MSQSVLNPIFDLKDKPLRDCSILSQDYVRLYDVNASRNPATDQSSDDKEIVLAAVAKSGEALHFADKNGK